MSARSEYQPSRLAICFPWAAGKTGVDLTAFDLAATAERRSLDPAWISGQQSECRRQGAATEVAGLF